MAKPSDLRWRLAGDDPQGAMFEEVERHVGGGEFRGLEFLHVRARRIINEVPDASRVPFRYTINAYRGCSHACSYCTSGDTPVLLAEGRLRPIADLRVGDLVVGTERVGRQRRYVATPVLAHWSATKPAFRVTLEGGSTLVASGDHRFLTERGWKHVTGSGWAPGCRGHLTAGNVLLGIGPMPLGPIENADYRRGYLCGVVRGDADIGHDDCRRRAGGHPVAHRFRLARVDPEPLARTRSYLGKATVERIEALFDWLPAPSEDWTKGFLAGIYDAEGHLGAGIRICTKDPQMLRRTSEAFDRLGFRTVREPARPNGAGNIRLLGGLPEVVRFVLTVDPATTAKRSITGRAMKGSGARQVLSVEALRLEMPMYDITTGTGDFIANGVVSHNCFARPTHEYLGLNAGEDFERRIVVKVNAVERLRAELAPGRWGGHHIAMGTNTDPYQRCEGKYRLTRGIIQELSAARNPFSILTKSTLILSDLDLLAEAARRTEVRANFSIGTLDEKVWRETEPGTPHPMRRVEAIGRLNEAGVECGVLVAPVLPGLSDRADQLEAVVKACVGAGARSVTPLLLHLRPGVREHYMGWLADTHPDLVGEHERRYRRAYASKAANEELAALVARLVERYGGRTATARQARTVQPDHPPGPSAPPGRQLRLGL